MQETEIKIYARGGGRRMRASETTSRCVLEKWELQFSGILFLGNIRTIWLSDSLIIVSMSSSTWSICRRSSEWDRRVEGSSGRTSCLDRMGNDWTFRRRDCIIMTMRRVVGVTLKISQHVTKCSHGAKLDNSPIQHLTFWRQLSWTHVYIMATRDAALVETDLALLVETSRKCLHRQLAKFSWLPKQNQRMWPWEIGLRKNFLTQILIGTCLLDTSGVPVRKLTRGGFWWNEIRST